MADKTNTQPAVTEENTQPAVQEREEIFGPKGAANEDPNLFISVNGENFILPKGKTSKVPKYIAEEYRRSLKAQEIMDEHIDQLKGAANEAK